MELRNYRRDRRVVSVFSSNSMKESEQADFLKCGAFALRIKAIDQIIYILKIFYHVGELQRFLKLLREKTPSESYCGVTGQKNPF